MTDDGKQTPTIVRNERGLSIAGTRITLYDVMDYLSWGWPAERIRDWFRLSDEQITGVMCYIDEHRAEVQAEYEQVLRDAEENRRYWEERNKELFARIAAMPRNPKYAAIHAKLDAARARRQRPT